MSDGDVVAIGWDVGGWNCETNPESRDALVCLRSNSERLGRAWRGSLRATINHSTSGRDFVERLGRLCSIDIELPRRVVIAVDAPFRFPAALIALQNGDAIDGVPDYSDQNPYLYRLTERRLVGEGVKPLSAVKDMIGSQASKAMHCLRRFAPKLLEPGVWGDGEGLEMIETYPALVRHRRKLPKPEGKPRDKDFADATTCAEVAMYFASRRGELEHPPANCDTDEGWIWAPRGTTR